MNQSLSRLPAPSGNFRPEWNFLDGPNPFGLSTPPVWFLEELWKFDPMLVIFRSQQEAVFRLCRRVQHGPPILHAVTGEREKPDTTMLVNHRLVPITSILPNPMVAWSPTLLADLAARDIQRAGGYRKAADLLDAHDDRADEAWKRQRDEGATDLARFSWHAMKWRKGETVDLGGRRHHGARTGSKPKRHYPAVRPRLQQEGPSGAIFTGRDNVPQEVRPFVVEDALTGAA